ncbi:SDR family oxidoreductase [Corynebacterium sp. 320]|uniref:mycolate reductase n=1 Tax=Corynebacterium TaxID=1716 RepID=UPI00125CA739|nr:MULTISPECIES: mycolate reductase [Corynebacterium]KAB1501443.1 SDR family oxidoreductase [Corynebacterium sp. 320]KAB1551740.1 SDR family oxidoreductase [Corynebacterium sp. 319]KAB3525801.1 SDR family oxidoreductase [Corynebacterium sp. 250]KAB3538735.1 SDR family oxidoreductase [Corynebacterium sp. 366]QNP92687.1 SDR family oxidoreductase [Corynebacterium zhongnanshanii]
MSSSLPAATAGSYAVVTGASSGIGAAIAKELARRGYDLILVARTMGPMQEIADAFPDRDVQIRSVDLSDAGARSTLLDELRSTTVSIIVNSAGIATFGNFADLDYSYERAQFELNATALFELTAAVIPGMVSRGTGGIINVGSAAGNTAIPGNATYVGTKAMVNTFTESLHYELAPRGVACTLLAPGPVREEVKEEDKLTEVDDAVPDFLWTTYEDCALDTLNALASNKLRVVPGPLSKAMNWASTYIPRRVASPIIGKFYSKMAAEGDA